MIKIKAHAKLNLQLHLFPPRKNGFYKVGFLNCKLELADDLIFKKQTREISLSCSDHSLPTDQRNLVYRSAWLLREKFANQNLGVKIHLHKRIPIKAGLGGGSADAAAVLNYLPQYWQIKVSPKQIFHLASLIGKDVIYCLTNSLAKISGTGEKIELLPEKPSKKDLVLIVPKTEKLATAWAYDHLLEKTLGKSAIKLEKCRQSIKDSDESGFYQALHNDFEKSMTKYYPIVEQVKQDLLKSGALTTLLCGSGLTVAGFFPNQSLAQKAHQILLNNYNYQQVIRTSTL